ncbi:phage tail sheath subtilisin-like domain-containing protein [Aneurinibacillus sp. Ricciae_BoGa-3]|uniref:phage tail sheath C-terminal domain-containing protein n=1 Tax=Aneurinibacillus sp. Ricciae_BoGa-3 TaxID=3022697 RepID=UPI0023424E71|nr:phage tail sheath C-terminal domain-containing protein [Aneurinibacillus sp. Ricciae_BoGa-3]WCK55429.1 phage tail sheath subtilisin-like domain-containing protein [Aneurinibacillus sp. Ricciae_BoGa-3]
MTLDYIVPRVGIDESNTGPRPTPGVSLSKISIVGSFPKGPVNQRISIGSADQAATLIGEYDPAFAGWLSLQGALNQGAADFDVVRVGGTGIASAKLTLKDSTGADSVTGTASSPGTWANGTNASGIKLAVTSGTTANTVKIVVISGSQSRSYDNIDLSNVEAIKDADITFTKAAGATAIPATISTTPLAGGLDGNAPADADILGTIGPDGTRTGLKIVEPANSSIVLAAQQSSAAVQAALLTHAANAGLEEGLRMVIINPAKGTAPNDAVSTVATLDSMRAIMPYPWLEPQEYQGNYVAPDGYLAGRLATLAAHNSPSNKEITGILSTERLLTGSELKTLTTGRIMPITPVNGRGFRIRNGVTLSSDSAWNQVNIRRIFDKIEMQVYSGTQWAISEDNTPQLWAAIADQIDIMLAIMKSNGEIYDFKPTVCDSTTNTPELVQARICKSKIRVRPIYAADFIDHGITRLVGNE